VTKVLVDARQGSNLLYLPLDKLLQSTAQPAQPADAASATANAASGASSTAAPSAPVTTPTTNFSNDNSRTRDFARTRERESR
jgi:membrane protease subunit HflK